MSGRDDPSAAAAGSRDEMGERDDEFGIDDRTETDDVDGRDETALERLRTEPRTHTAALVVAIAVGLLLSWLHWFGLVLGGGLVGLVSSTLPRAVLGAVGFGALVLVVFAISLGGSVWPVLEMTPVVYVAVASAIGLPLLGSLLRGIV